MSGNASLGTAGATITAGQQCYLESSSGTWKPGQANNAAKNAPKGIALTGAVANAFVVIAGVACQVTIGAAVVKGTPYYQGAAIAGDIVPATDLVTGWNTNLIGVGANATDILLAFYNSGVST